MDNRKTAFDCEQYKKELRESEEKFSRIFKLSPDSIIVSGLQDGLLIEANDQTARQFGYTQDELIGHSALAKDLGLWSNDRVRQEFIRQLQESKEITGFEAIFRRKEGSTFNGLISAKIIDIKGKLCMLSLIRDITERKIFLDALERSQKRYKLIFENMLNAFALHEIVLDDAGHAVDYVFLEVNPAFEKMLGIKKEEIIGRRVTEVIPGTQNDPVNWIQKYGAVAAGAGSLKFENYSFGLGKWFEINAFSNKEGQFVTIFEDITERKQADISLQESEAKLREAQKLAQLGYWHWDIKTGKVEWSQEVFNIFRLDPKEFTPQIDSIMALSPWPLDHARDNELIQRALASRQKGDYEQRFLRPDKSTGYYYSTFQGNYDQHGELVSIVGTVMDITERKLAEEQGKRNESFLNAIIENIPDMIFVKDAKDLRFVRFNQAGQKLLGYSPEELLGKNDFDFFPQDEAEFFNEKDRAVLNTKQGVEIPEETIKIKSGEQRILHTKKIPILDDQGNAVYLLGISEDITHHKKTENALREAEIRYRLLFELSPQGIVIIDPQTTRFLEFNDMAHRQLGYSREEFAQLSITDLEVAELTEETRQPITQVLSGGRQEFETKHRCRNGEIRDISVTAQTVQILGKQVYYCIWRDISERKSIEAENSKRSRELEIFYQASIGREERIIELKQEIEQLKKELNK